VDSFSLPIGLFDLLCTPSTHALKRLRYTSLGHFPFTTQYGVSPFPCTATILTYHVRDSGMVSNLALEIPHLIRQMGSFEEPMSKQWAMPISTPYSPGLKCSEYSPHYFISQVMTWISVAAAPANRRLEPELEPAPIRAKPSCIWSSRHFSRLPLSRLTAC